MMLEKPAVLDAPVHDDLGKDRDRCKALGRVHEDVAAMGRGGKDIVYPDGGMVNPRNTSKRCSKSTCKVPGKRDRKTFRCTDHRCGLSLDSDRNAARNILVAPLSAGATRSRGGCPLPPTPLTATAWA